MKGKGPFDFLGGLVLELGAVGAVLYFLPNLGWEKLTVTSAPQEALAASPSAAPTVRFRPSDAGRVQPTILTETTSADRVMQPRAPIESTLRDTGRRLWEQAYTQFSADPRESASPASSSQVQPSQPKDQSAAAASPGSYGRFPRDYRY